MDRATNSAHWYWSWSDPSATGVGSFQAVQFQCDSANETSSSRVIWSSQLPPSKTVPCPLVPTPLNATVCFPDGAAARAGTANAVAEPQSSPATTTEAANRLRCMCVTLSPLLNSFRGKGPAVSMRRVNQVGYPLAPACQYAMRHQLGCSPGLYRVIRGYQHIADLT